MCVWGEVQSWAGCGDEVGAPAALVGGLFWSILVWSVTSRKRKERGVTEASL